MRGNEFCVLTKFNENSESLYLDANCLLRVEINVKPRVKRNVGDFSIWPAYCFLDFLCGPAPLLEFLFLLAQG